MKVLNTDPVGTVSRRIRQLGNKLPIPKCLTLAPAGRRYFTWRSDSRSASLYQDVKADSKFHWLFAQTEANGNGARHRTRAAGSIVMPHDSAKLDWFLRSLPKWFLEGKIF